VNVKVDLKKILKKSVKNVIFIKINVYFHVLKIQFQMKLKEYVNL